jgi:hypothetical protein
MNNASGWLFVMQRIKRDTLIEHKTFATVRTREQSLFQNLTGSRLSGRETVIVLETSAHAQYLSSGHSGDSILVPIIPH